MAFKFPDPTKLGSQRIALDGSNVKVSINGVKLLKCVSKIDYGVTVEGIEDQYGLGDREAFALTAGVIKAGELTVEIFADKVDMARALISEAGLFFSSPVDIEIIEDAGSSAGLSALLASLAGSARSITAKGCKLTGISGSIETGGAALKEPLKFKPLQYLFNGKSGLAGLGI